MLTKQPFPILVVFEAQMKPGLQALSGEIESAKITPERAVVKPCDAMAGMSVIADSSSENRNIVAWSLLAKHAVVLRIQYALAAVKLASEH